MYPRVSTYTWVKEYTPNKEIGQVFRHVWQVSRKCRVVSVINTCWTQIRVAGRRDQQVSSSILLISSSLYPLWVPILDLHQWQSKEFQILTAHSFSHFNHILFLNSNSPYHTFKEVHLQYRDKLKAYKDPLDDHHFLGSSRSLSNKTILSSANCKWDTTFPLRPTLLPYHSSVHCSLQVVIRSFHHLVE